MSLLWQNKYISTWLRVDYVHRGNFVDVVFSCDSFYRGKFSLSFVIEIVLAKRDLSVKKNQLRTEADKQ